MNLSQAPDKYDRRDQQAVRLELKKADAENLKFGRNIELARGEKLILRSPDGSQFYLTVDNGGALTATAL